MASASEQPAITLDPRTYDRAQACVHCGLCLPACPTYAQNGLEADSPRGRIYLMKALADGRIEATDNVVHHLDLCLDCRACETACPSGVIYHEVIEETRTQLASNRKPQGSARLVQWLTRHIFTKPGRLKLALLGPRLLQAIRIWPVFSAITARLLPVRLAKMQQMLPTAGPLWESRLAKRYPAHGKRRHTVGFFAGCVSSVLQQEVNRKAIALLQMCGCDVLVPRGQQCCGAIHHHSGQPGPAIAMAKRNIECFKDVDHIATCVAGDGAMLKQYEHLLRDETDWAKRADDFAARVRDINQLLHDYDHEPPTHAVNVTAAYHDACHLAHGQNVTTQPRELLRAVPGLMLRSLPESDMCCGAAGTYNLDQPEMSRSLAERKLANITATGASICITSNIGCGMQIESEARRIGMDLKVQHPVEVLYAAYFGPEA